MALARVVTPQRRAALGALGAVVFLLLLSALDGLTRGSLRLPALVPPFGASVAIVFFTPESPLGRPWNVMAGHVLSAIAASVVIALLPAAPAMVQVSVAVPIAVMLMLATSSFHPPGGATALLACVAQPKLGFGIVLSILLGTLLLVGVRTKLDWLLTLWSRRAQSSRKVTDVLAEATRSLHPTELGVEE